MSIVRSYPYFVKSLPLGNAEEWFKQTGLRPEEIARIDEYVKQKLPDWQKLPEKQAIRIVKELNEAPRTIIIYSSDKGLSVFICCKEKGISPVGRGVDKKVTRAVEWLSRTLWAQYTNLSVSSFCIDSVSRGVEIHSELSCNPRVLPSPDMILKYKNKKGRKITFFAPLRDGDLESLLKEESWKSQKFSLARQILELGRFLDFKKVRGNDLSPKNILYFLDSNGRIQLQANDFDCVFTEVEQKPEKGPINHEMVAWLIGSLKEPQLREAVRLYVEKSAAAALEFVNELGAPGDFSAGENPEGQQAKKRRTSN